MLWRLLLVLVALTACSTPGAYVCVTDDDCGTGVCVTGPEGASHCSTEVADAAATDATDAAAPLDTTPGCDGGACAHPPDACYVGSALPRAPGCTEQVCARLASCCEVSWTTMCIQLAEIECDMSCSSRVVWAGDDVIETVDFGAVVDGEPAATVLTPGFGVTGQVYQSLAWVDFERDQDPELLLVTSSGHHQQVLRRTPTTWTRVRDLTTLQLPAYSAYGVAAGDLDDDGDLDVALTGASPGLVSLRRVEAGPVLSAGPPHPEVDNYNAAWVEIGDHDADGDDDVVVYNYNTNGGAARGVGTLLLGRPHTAGGGVGGPGHTVALPVMVEPRRARFGDVDGDGDLDLAIATIGIVVVLRYHAGVYESTPLWSYTTSPPLPADTTTDYADAAWIDIDGDRDLDLAVVDRSSGAATYLKVFRNSGVDLDDQPIWVSPQLVSAHQIAVGDVDGDGDLDMAIAGHDTRNCLYLNNGDRTFRRSTWTSTTTSRMHGVVMTPTPRT